MRKITAVIFDYGFTLSCEHYFNRPHPAILRWRELVQECAFRDDAFVRRWAAGEAGLGELAGRIAEKSGIAPEEVLHYLREGCRSLAENAAVLDFARLLRQSGVPIGLVTLNFDVFTEVIAPAHGYAELFSVIVNSADQGETDKLRLWPLALTELTGKADYANALLIEDCGRMTRRFRAQGGAALRYTDDVRFRREIGRCRLDGQALLVPQAWFGA